MGKAPPWAPQKRRRPRDWQRTNEKLVQRGDISFYLEFLDTRDADIARAKATNGNAYGSPGETLVPKYAPLLSQLNAPDALREQVLVGIHEAGRVTLADLRAFLDKTLFAFQWRRQAGARG